MLKLHIFLAVLLAPAAARAAGFGGEARFVELYVAHILSALAVLTAASELLTRAKPDAAKVARLFWNWLLLLSFLTCAVSGLLLLTPLGGKLRFYVFHLHVWGGAGAAWAGVYHTLKRLRGMVS